MMTFDEMETVVELCDSLSDVKRKQACRQRKKTTED